MLIGIQIIGIAFIAGNYYMTTSNNLNETYLFYMDYRKICFFGYLFSFGFGFILLLITIGLIISRKRKIEVYKILNETKNLN